MPRTTPCEPLVEIECISEEGHGALPLRDVRLGKLVASGLACRHGHSPILIVDAAHDVPLSSRETPATEPRVEHIS